MPKMKNLDYVVLLDHYGALLTEKQRGMLSDYYDDDLSLAEIAESRGITRQAVLDSLRRGEHQLDSYEDQMHFAEKHSRCLALFREIAECSSCPAEIAALAEKGITLLEQ